MTARERTAAVATTGAASTGGLVLLAISPAAFLTAVIAVFVVLRQVRRHGHERRARPVTPWS